MESTQKPESSPLSADNFVLVLGEPKTRLVCNTKKKKNPNLSQPQVFSFQLFTKYGGFKASDTQPGTLVAVGGPRGAGQQRSFSSSPSQTFQPLSPSVLAVGTFLP